MLPDDSNTKAITTLSLSFIGSIQNPEIEGLAQKSGVVNYANGNKSYTNVPTYGGLIYKELYPGIDLRYEDKSSFLKGSYIVKPGYEPVVIRWKYKEANAVNVDESGNLLINLSNKKVIEEAPSAYQVIDGKTTTVDVKYKIFEDSSVGFSLGKYNTYYPLVIDPVLDYSSFVGGSSLDWGTSIKVDSSNNVYITGFTYSSNYPITAAAADGQCNQGNPCGSTYYDVFISKFDPTGSSLIYSTYLGGNDSERSDAITVDNQGNAYVTGVTGSNDFPTTPGAFRTTTGGRNDAFITKLSPTGSIVYSTYLGGIEGDTPAGIDVDTSGNAYITGDTQSPNFPTTPGAYNTTGSFSTTVHRDSFVTKINDTGSSLIYSTFLGRNAEGAQHRIAIDSNGSAYVTTNGFTGKLSPNGNSLVYSTGLGGRDIDVDDIGNAYVTGDSGNAAFAAKLNTVGNTVYLTTLNGGGNDQGWGIVADNSGNSYVTGYTTSSDFPTTNGAFATTLPIGIGSDGFLAKIGGSGTIIYSTYLGGGQGRDIAIDQAGLVYLTGITDNVFVTTPGSFDTSYNGTEDAYIKKINMQFQPTVDAGGPYQVDESGLIQTIQVTANGNDLENQPLTYAWDLDNNGSFETPGQTVTFSASYLDGPGNNTIAVRVTDTDNLSATDQATVTVQNVTPTVGTITVSNAVIQVNNSITVSANFNDPGALDTHTASWNWGDGNTTTGAVTETNGSGSVLDSHTYDTTGVYTITLTVTDKDNGQGMQTYQYVSVYNPTAQGLFSAGQHYTSPAGAYNQNTNASGKVFFGLTYKYQGSVPVGQRQFSLDFNSANFHFNATSISSLVISNGIGTLRGIGTVNDSGTYSFLVTGSENANTIRIQIKDTSGNTIYDTQQGTSDNATPTTSVTGNVITH